jgi:hypothetical protein
MVCLANFGRFTMASLSNETELISSGHRRVLSHWTTIVRSLRGVIVFTIFPITVLLAGDPKDAIQDTVAKLASNLIGSVYFVSGWTQPRVVEHLRLVEGANVEFRFRECDEVITPPECDSRHKWRSIKQTLLLARMKPGSVKVLEVTGTGPANSNTGHALIYRCRENSSCTVGDLGSYVTPIIPCNTRELCERASADLETLIDAIQSIDTK